MQADFHLPLLVQGMGKSAKRCSGIKVTCKYLIVDMAKLGRYAVSWRSFGLSWQAGSKKKSETNGEKNKPLVLPWKLQFARHFEYSPKDHLHHIRSSSPQNSYKRDQPHTMKPKAELRRQSPGLQQKDG